MFWGTKFCAGAVTAGAVAVGSALDVLSSVFCATTGAAVAGDWLALPLVRVAAATPAVNTPNVAADTANVTTRALPAACLRRFAG
jgi:hypothetical protein